MLNHADTGRCGSWMFIWMCSRPVEPNIRKEDPWHSMAFHEKIHGIPCLFWTWPIDIFQPGAPRLEAACTRLRDSLDKVGEEIQIGGALGQRTKGESTTFPWDMIYKREIFQYESWLVVWNMFFPHSVGNHSPNWRSHIFHMGRYTTHQKVPGLCNSQNETEIPRISILRGSAFTLIFLFGWSMDWFKGKLKPESPMNFMGKSMVSCRCSFKPIHWDDGLGIPGMTILRSHKDSWILDFDMRCRPWHVFGLGHVLISLEQTVTTRIIHYNNLLMSFSKKK